MLKNIIKNIEFPLFIFISKKFQSEKFITQRLPNIFGNLDIVDQIYPIKVEPIESLYGRLVKVN
jgi:hypothetical protein